MQQAFDALRTGATFNRKRFRSDIEFFQGACMLHARFHFILCLRSCVVATCLINVRHAPVQCSSLGNLLAQGGARQTATPQRSTLAQTQLAAGLAQRRTAGTAAPQPPWQCLETRSRCLAAACLSFQPCVAGAPPP